jgi:hypothetical protein
VVADIAKLSVGRGEYYTRELATDHKRICPATDGWLEANHFVHPPGQPTGATPRHDGAHFEAQLRLYRWARSLGVVARLERVSKSRTTTWSGRTAMRGS